MARPFQEMIRAVCHCVVCGIPVALFRRPGRDVCFLASEPAEDFAGPVFSVIPWGCRWAGRIRIGGVDNPRTVPELSACTGGCPPLCAPSDTDPQQYLHAVGSLIETLRHRGGKLVVSRVKSYPFGPDALGPAISSVFEAFPDAFCNFFFHPAVGCWLGATPEVLLSCDSRGAFSTMALAGTHRSGKDWDSKNIEEQKIVTDYIMSILTPMSRDIIADGPQSLPFGSIEHLCTVISGTFSDSVSHGAAVDALAPTPAVGGFPSADVDALISAAEAHSRRCYAGTLTVENAGENHSYVNLRCAEFTPGQVTFYAGGGITALSVPADEWEETENKIGQIAPHVLNVLNRHVAESE